MIHGSVPLPPSVVVATAATTCCALTVTWTPSPQSATTAPVDFFNVSCSTVDAGPAMALSALVPGLRCKRRCAARDCFSVTVVVLVVPFADLTWPGSCLGAEVKKPRCHAVPNHPPVASVVGPRAVRCVSHPLTPTTGDAVSTTLQPLAPKRSFACAVATVGSSGTGGNRTVCCVTPSPGTPDPPHELFVTRVGGGCPRVLLSWKGPGVDGLGGPGATLLAFNVFQGAPCVE